VCDSKITLQTTRHCEERSDEAILLKFHGVRIASWSLSRYAGLAMTLFITGIFRKRSTSRAHFILENPVAL
jgi:hypothetical protein